MAKILVVDDIEDNITLLCFNLEDDGHEVISARSGELCLQKTAEHQPDLILLDLMMPGMSGTETLVQLQANPDFKHIPVIMVSANDDDDSIIDALDVGAYDYVTKPFIYPVLAARMRSALRLLDSQQKLREANTQLARLASLDSLTETYNRRHFLELANTEFAKARRYRRPLSLIMLDVDKFKNINDSYGHPCGDQALIALTKQCRAVGRRSEIIGRFGGEEFAICCPDTDANGALSVAERLRKTVEQMQMPHEQQTIQFTISLGITTLQASDQTLDDLIKRADQLLYLSKEQGRNCSSSDSDSLQR